MDFKMIAEWLVIVGGLVHLLSGLGQSAIVAMVPMLNIVQIVVGISAVYLLAKKLKFL